MKSNTPYILFEAKTPWSFGRMRDWDPPPTWKTAHRIKIETQRVKLETKQIDKHAGPWTTIDARAGALGKLDTRSVWTRSQARKMWIRDSIQRMWIEERERNRDRERKNVSRHETFPKIKLQQETSPVGDLPLNVTQAAAHKERWREQKQ